MNQDIQAYNDRQTSDYKAVCQKLAELVDSGLPEAESKIWHGHPVWFIAGNPIVGYSVQKSGVRLMFWSGRSFDEPELVGKSKFKDASIFYNAVNEVDESKLARWLEISKTIQWDYKNIVKLKGVLNRLK